MFSWYAKCWKQYADFHSRARRSEYWYFFLVNWLVSILLALVLPALSGIYSLATFIPSLAVAVRRLHDTGHSGWWYFILLVPLVGWIIFLVFLCTNSVPETNKWGENPKA